MGTRDAESRPHQPLSLSLLDPYDQSSGSLASSCSNGFPTLPAFLTGIRAKGHLTPALAKQWRWLGVTEVRFTSAAGTLTHSIGGIMSSTNLATS